ncbi:uncharacterized protein LOC110838496 isoform X2 [Zootermopsis nevadensis]|uniref:uncharacterized protein LOC110838496 isoform X2 n=1 Tax=Zootermopsis nevadensis TaxID=136037 RepID=UPI000B8E28CC|nr:uncharacterized protein LOC110838496 isoform X2 [Zootermopsis nevadensis]
MDSLVDTKEEDGYRHFHFRENLKPHSANQVKMMKKKLEDIHKIEVSGEITSGSNQKSFPSPVTNESIEVSPAVGSGKEHQTRKSAALECASIRKRSLCGYATLLDIAMMNNEGFPASRVLPTEELVPNSYHQSFHIARWKAWLRETPQWIINMGRQNLWMLEGQNGHQTPQNEANSNDVQKHISDTYVEMKEKNESSEQDSKIKEEHLTEWRDWSLQLTDRNSLLITGKRNQNTIQLSRDVSYCKRIDANTLLHNDGSVYILNGMPDHFTNLPYYVRNKFQCGFPDDWKDVKCKWIKYVKEGSPCDFSWTVETDECVSNAAVVEKCTQPNTSCQDGFSITSSHLRMDEIYQHEMPVNDEKYRQSHSVALQNEVNQLNSKDKQKCLKETQSLVTQKNSRDSFECLLNVIVTGTLNPDKSSHYSSSDGSDHASCAIYSSGTPKKVSNPNDADITNNVTEANITVNQEISLERWTPVLINGCDLKVNGYIKSELHTEVAHTTDIVVKRKTNISFQCKDGKTYKLMGTFVDPKNTVPSLIKKKLSKGLPAQWKKMMKTWDSLMLSTRNQN